MIKNKYLSEFFALNCAVDVLNTVGHVNNMIKEITEAMSLRKRVKEIVLREEPNTFAVYDLCAGNCLFGVMVAYTLPVRYVIGLDKRESPIDLKKIHKYRYEQRDIYDDLTVAPNTIICAIHPCRNLAERIIDIYLNNEGAKKLVLMPCCFNKAFLTDLKAPSYILAKLSNDDKWAWHLANKVDGEVYRDDSVLSPKNRIIIAEK